MKKFRLKTKDPVFRYASEMPVNNFTFENLDSEKINQLDYVKVLESCKDDLHISESFIKRAKECGTYRDEVYNFDLSRARLLRSNFCRERFCPTDMRIRSSSLYQKVKTCLYNLPDIYKVVFVTLTVPSVSSPSDLRKTCSRMSSAFCKITHLPLWSDIEGYYRSLEITYNPENGFHPHYHILLIVKKNVNLNKYQFIIQWTARFLGVKAYKDRIVTALVENNAMSYNCARRYVLDMLKGLHPYWARDYRFLTKNGLHFVMDAFKDVTDMKMAAYSCKYAFKGSDFLGYGSDVFKGFFLGASRLHLSAFGGVLRDLAAAYDRGEIGENKKIVPDIYVRRFLLVYHFSVRRFVCISEQSFNASEWNAYKAPVTSVSYREHASLLRSVSSLGKYIDAGEIITNYLKDCSGDLYFLSVDCWNRSYSESERNDIRSAAYNWYARKCLPPVWLRSAISSADPVY